MPRLTIDNVPVDVPAGTTVLEAARTVGIVIPHFCYHPALGSVGACRVCAVKLLDGPVKGIQMSCMLPAQDGMVVSTVDAEAQAMRRHVIEWLMLNHPHDCPVCDEGGECLLQDFTVAGGHGIRRYQGRKRTHRNQFLGPHIEHEMNRCIQCYRCARFYQEVAGGSDFGVMGSASRVYFGRFRDGEFESAFSGNLVDICPTGVFTDKTARFRARYWDYEMAPSVCPHCSLGCNTVPAARYRELLKVMARRNDAVNGWFICDQGRFGNGAVNDPARSRAPSIGGKEASWDDALDRLLFRVGELYDLHGAGCLAVVGSPRLPLEGAVLLPRLAELLGARFLSYFVTTEESSRHITATSLLNEVTVASQSDVRKADCIAIVDCDLMEEGPMLALAVRQAWRQGAPLFLVGKHAPLAQAKAIGVEAVQLDIPEEVPFGIYDRPVIICGTRHSTPATIARIMKSGTTPICLLSGPNACGAALLASQHEAVPLAEAIASGQVKGVIGIEADIPAELLEGVPFVAAMDWLPTSFTGKADIILPTTSWVEMDGTYVNVEGRGQRFRRVMQPGVPIRGLDPARHPPRAHRALPPGSSIRPAWQAIAALLERLGDEPLSEPLRGKWERLRSLDPEGEGMIIATHREPLS